MTKDHYSPIAYPKELSETDVQYRLMKALDNLGLDFRSEVKVEPKFGCRGARLDLVVFLGETASVIIEVKKKDHGSAMVQQKHYQELTGLPVLVCGGVIEIEDTITKIKELIN